MSSALMIWNPILCWLRMLSLCYFGVILCIISGLIQLSEKRLLNSLSTKSLWHSTFLVAYLEEIKVNDKYGSSRYIVSEMKRVNMEAMNTLHLIER